MRSSEITEDLTGVTEKRRLSGCIFANTNNSLYNVQNPDFFTLKGSLESLFEKLGILKRVVFSAFSAEDVEKYKFLHPAQSASIAILGKNKEPAGFIGKLHPVLSDKLKFNQDLFIFELDLEELISSIPQNYTKFKKLPIFAPVYRDIAFIVDKNITIEQINKVIKKSATNTIFKSSKVFDIYEGKGIEEGKKSLAFRVVLQDENKTLTDETIQEEINKIKSGLQKNIIGLSLR